MVAKPRANEASLPTERSSFWVYPNCSSLASSVLAGGGTCASVGGARSVIVSPAQNGGVGAPQITPSGVRAEVPNSDLLITHVYQSVRGREEHRDRQ